MTPVVTIDGPSGTGKGTIAELVARRLGWHYLDSGALYRVLGLAAQRRGLDLDLGDDIASLASTMAVEFRDGLVYLDGENVAEAIRAEEVSNAASRVAAHGAVRARLIARQREAAELPGLVADGRDMGTVIFPDAPAKVFLTASSEERARRRYKQLKQKGLDVSLSEIAAAIRERDERDRNRSAAPLTAPSGALTVDTTVLTIEEVLDKVLEAVKIAFPDQTD